MNRDADAAAIAKSNFYERDLSMAAALFDQSLDQIFRSARTYSRIAAWRAGRTSKTQP